MVACFYQVAYFCTKQIHMAHDHDHSEPEQNEIGGPVTFAIFCFVVAIVIIYFLSA